MFGIPQIHTLRITPQPCISLHILFNCGTQWPKNQRVNILTAPLYIEASGIIRSNCIIKNGLSIFERTTEDLPGFLQVAYQFLDIKYPKFYKMDNLSKLGWLGTEVLLKESFDRERY